VTDRRPSDRIGTSTLRSAISGFVVGAVATVPMTGAFWVSRRGGLIDELPPHKAVRSVAHRLPEPHLSWISAVAHLLIGAGAGAGATYGAAVPRRSWGPVTGAAFGVAVWVVGYEGVMPAATDIRPAHRDDRARALTIFVAHITYGVVLGLLVSRSREKRLTVS
jgi:hypothetical protein